MSGMVLLLHLYISTPDIMVQVPNPAFLSAYSFNCFHMRLLSAAWSVVSTSIFLFANDALKTDERGAATASRICHEVPVPNRSVSTRALSTLRYFFYKEELVFLSDVAQFLRKCISLFAQQVGFEENGSS